MGVRPSCALISAVSFHALPLSPHGHSLSVSVFTWCIPLVWRHLSYGLRAHLTPPCPHLNHWHQQWPYFQAGSCSEAPWVRTSANILPSHNSTQKTDQASQLPLKNVQNPPFSLDPWGSPLSMVPQSVSWPVHTEHQASVQTACLILQALHAEVIYAQTCTKDCPLSLILTSQSQAQVSSCLLKISHYLTGISNLLLPNSSPHPHAPSALPHPHHSISVTNTHILQLLVPVTWQSSWMSYSSNYILYPPRIPYFSWQYSSSSHHNHSNEIIALCIKLKVCTRLLQPHASLSTRLTQELMIQRKASMWDFTAHCLIKA